MMAIFLATVLVPTYATFYVGTTPSSGKPDNQTKFYFTICRIYTNPQIKYRAAHKNTSAFPALVSNC